MIEVEQCTDIIKIVTQRHDRDAVTQQTGGQLGVWRRMYEYRHVRHQGVVDADSNTRHRSGNAICHRRDSIHHGNPRRGTCTKEVRQSCARHTCTNDGHDRIGDIHRLNHVWSFGADGELAPSTLLRGNATLAAQTQHAGHDAS